MPPQQGWGTSPEEATEWLWVPTGPDKAMRREGWLGGSNSFTFNVLLLGEHQTPNKRSWLEILSWAPPCCLSAAGRPGVYFCGKHCPSCGEIPIHSGCLGSSKSLCSSVPSESALGDTGCWWWRLSSGAQMAKSRKNREHMTQS